MARQLAVQQLKKQQLCSSKAARTGRKGCTVQGRSVERPESKTSNCSPDNSISAVKVFGAKVSDLGQERWH
ncbi:hypothetical protein STEG23_022630, partial [Scotinomys teguina]